MPADSAAVEATKKRVRDAVVLFEHKEGSRLVDIKDISTLVRSLGVNPTNAQTTGLTDQLAQLNAEGDHLTTMMQLEHIETVVTNFLIQQEAQLFRDDYHTLIRAFRAFDAEGKGWVDADMLKLLLCARGEAMTEDEINKMLIYAADENGRVYYEDYAQKLCNDGRKL